MKRETKRKRFLSAFLALLIIGFFASASIYAQRADQNPGLMFNIPSDWQVSTVNGMTSYTSPDYSYTLIVTPFSTTSGSADYTSQSNLEYFLNNYKWTADNKLTPYTFDTWQGYNTVAHTNLNGKDVTGYVYYSYDPSTPGRGYYYYMYTPTSNWSTNQSEIQKIVSSVKYTQPQTPTSSSLMFDLPLGWSSNVSSDGVTTYTSPDYSYSIVVSPYSSNSATTDYTSQSNLDYFLQTGKWTAESAYNPYKYDNWMGYNTVAHTNLNGQDVTGYVNYGYDPNNPGRGYYYYIYTPSSKWTTGQAEMQKLMNSAKYVPVNPNLDTK